ncbi:MAG: type II toxin-antitoxin system HicB family antitoxin [Chitinophagaceae bacterium]|nr:type II toxin-antitoxin system HicB family antitoxin [Chitinophagaceae bacterium]
MNMTLRVSKGEDFFLGTIKEIPEVITQGKTVEETKENILDALQIYLESMQDETADIDSILEESIKIG